MLIQHNLRFIAGFSTGSDIIFQELCCEDSTLECVAKNEIVRVCLTHPFSTGCIYHGSSTASHMRLVGEFLRPCDTDLDGDVLLYVSVRG